MRHDLEARLRAGLLFGVQWGAAVFVIAACLGLFAVGFTDYLQTRARAAQAEVFINGNAAAWKFLGDAYRQSQRPGPPAK